MLESIWYSLGYYYVFDSSIMQWKVWEVKVVQDLNFRVYILCGLGRLFLNYNIYICKMVLKIVFLVGFQNKVDCVSKVFWYWNEFSQFLVLLEMRIFFCWGRQQVNISMVVGILEEVSFGVVKYRILLGNVQGRFFGGGVIFFKDVWKLFRW